MPATDHSCTTRISQTLPRRHVAQKPTAAAAAEGGRRAADERASDIPAAACRPQAGGPRLPEATTGFAAELEACGPSLRRYARGLLRDPGAAEDLVQDCLARAGAPALLARRGEPAALAVPHPA